MSVLRVAVLVVGVALGVSAVALASSGCGLGPSLRLALPGLILVGAVVVERWRYRGLAGGLPGPGWHTTGERFIDPETGRLVTVYYRPSTGERRYTTG
ncbi:MAG: hypothetical protein ACREE2_00665 [Stellaceae bacterium]